MRVRLRGLLAAITSPAALPAAPRPNRRSSFQQLFHRCGKVSALQNADRNHFMSPTPDA